VIKPLLLLPPHFPRRPSFTLVELMVVVMIITILAAVLLVGIAGVQNEARRERTESQIRRIDAYITSMWESYQTRRLPVHTKEGTVTPKDAALNRLYVLREIMRMELPDRMTDLVETEVDMSTSALKVKSPKTRRANVTMIEHTSRLEAYVSKITDTWSSEHQSSECLYMILSLPGPDGESGLKSFSAAEIGDIDADGMPEVLDAWGMPIKFLRWAPGFRSPMQPGDPSLGTDQFDLAGVDPYDPSNSNRGRHFALHPLIYSAGPDREYEIFTDNINDAFIYTSTTPPNDPYVVLGGMQFGQVLPVGLARPYEDNIHNHLLSTR
jgi:Tfp pilus assembly protein PilE